jgi:hypothetical protein
VNKDDAIIQLLTEIRDNQREEIAWRKKVIEESVALAREPALAATCTDRPLRTDRGRRSSRVGLADRAGGCHREGVPEGMHFSPLARGRT